MLAMSVFHDLRDQSDWTAEADQARLKSGPIALIFKAANILI